MAIKRGWHSKEYYAAYREANRARIRENYRRWREKIKRENPEKLRAAIHRDNHREGAAEIRRRYRQKRRIWLEDWYRLYKNKKYMESVINIVPPELQDDRRLLYEFNSRVLRDGRPSSKVDTSR